MKKIIIPQNKAILSFVKNICVILWMAITFIACSGSGSETEPVSQPTESIMISASENLSPSFDSDGGSYTISFKATEVWTASLVNNRANAWCMVDPASGLKGVNTLTIHVKENEETDDRNAVIELKAGSTVKNINVSQKQKNALTLTTNKYQLPSKGGELEIEIKANVKYSYTIDDKCKEWISYVGSRAMSTSYLKFKVSENLHEKREAVIVISDGTLEEKVTVYQEAASPSIVLSQDEYVVSAKGETISVDVSSNVDVEVQMPDVNWVKENKSRAFSTHTYHYVISENEEYDQRKAEIIFRNKENNLAEKVLIQQLQKDAIVIAENEYTLKAGGGHLDFNVNSNVEFKVTVEGEWIKHVESRGLTEKALYFDVAENTSEDAREGKIILTSENIQQEIKILQKGVGLPYAEYYMPCVEWGLSIEKVKKLMTDYILMYEDSQRIIYGNVEPYIVIVYEFSSNELYLASRYSSDDNEKNFDSNIRNLHQSYKHVPEHGSSRFWDETSRTFMQIVSVINPSSEKEYTCFSWVGLDWIK